MKRKNKLFEVSADIILMKKLLSIKYISCSLVVGCTGGSEAIKDGFKLVRPQGRRSLGKVNGVSLSEGIGHLARYEESIKDVKRSVSSVGGNYFHIQKIVRDGAMVTGDAYHCDKN